MQVETRLGHYALKAQNFKVRLPKLGVFTPEYTINPIDLIEGTLIGHVSILPSGPTFVISKITKIHHKNDEFLVIDWPSHITSEPILHGWDIRTVSMLAVPSFFLDLNTVQCILRFSER